MAEHSGARLRPYFEGWYFKHQAGGRSLALIPGVSRDGLGGGQAFIQVLTDTASYFVPDPVEAFAVRRAPLGVRVGRSVFTGEGIFLDIRTPEIRLQGKMHYGPLSPLKADIMGPFRFVPRMECRHGVVSMRHTLRGRLRLQDEAVAFDGGVGYIETDRGVSFPRDYLWTQCSAPELDASLMVSVASIPFLGREFQGCIAAVQCGDRELRMGTYSGVKVRRYSPSGLILQQGRHCLKAEFQDASRQVLQAPVCGGMIRPVRETIACTARYRLYERGRLLLDWTSAQASLESARAE